MNGELPLEQQSQPQPIHHPERFVRRVTLSDLVPPEEIQRINGERQEAWRKVVEEYPHLHPTRIASRILLRQRGIS